MTTALTLARELLACFQAELGALAPPLLPIAPEHVMLRPGAQVTPLLGTADDECCRGLGWVRIAEISGVRQLGDSDNVSCFGQERILTLELGAVRCAPSSDVASVPTEEQWDFAATQLDADQGAMEAAICCAFRGPDVSLAVEEVAVGVYQPSGVDGNCIGGTMQVLIRMSACC
jgi:hypothetical protein